MIPGHPRSLPPLLAACRPRHRLTGVIVEATFSLIPITRALIGVDTTRYRDLDSPMVAMVAMVEADKNYRYDMAWLDNPHPK